jgi:hypothetical protein
MASSKNHLKGSTRHDRAKKKLLNGIKQKSLKGFNFAMIELNNYSMALNNNYSKGSTSP